MISFSIILVFFYTFTSFPPIQTPTNFVQQEPFFANIEIDTSGEKLNIIGKFINNSDSTIFIEYKMQTNKIGKSGKSLSTQSGKYISENNSELILTKVGLNIDNSTKYDIILKVFKEEELISADSLNYIPENH
jgi:hypothetical protein